MSAKQGQPEPARIQPNHVAVNDRRVSLGVFPTPLQSMTDWGVPSTGGATGQAGQAGRAGRYVKRDDLAGFFVAGNKTRPLEFLLGDALADKAKTMVGCGTSGSNFIAALALAARQAGLECQLLISGESQASISLDIARAAGARIHFTTLPREDLDAAVTERAEQLTHDGSPAYPVPRGGASSAGSLGFARAAVEINEQLAGRPTTIVLPVGSGASMAGLCAGIVAHNLPHRVIGVSVSRPLEQIKERIAELTTECLRLLEAPTRKVSPMLANSLTVIDRTAPPTALDLSIAHDAMRRYPFTVDLHYGLPTLSEATSWMDANPDASMVYWCTGGVLGYPELIRAMAAA